MSKIIRITLLAVLMAAVGLAAFAAGGGESQGAKKGIVIGFSNAGMGDSWRQFLVANFKAECAKHPEIKEYFITNADEKPEKQLADIEDLLVKGVNALIVYPTVADAIIPAIEKVYAQGIPVIVFGGKIGTTKLTCPVLQDLLEFGRAQAKWLAEELKGKGKIVMLSGIAGNTTAEDRLAGAREVFKQYPNIQILDHQYCDWSPPKAKSIMEAMIQAFPEIDGIWADSGLMSWPALQALKEAVAAGPHGNQLPGQVRRQQGARLRVPHDDAPLGRGGEAGPRGGEGREGREEAGAEVPRLRSGRNPAAQQARPLRLVVDRRRPDARRVPAQG
jgi:ABC-type sugar transport system substrate-binding protein